MLTAIQSRAARIMAANRSEESYFAGGAVLNEHTERVSDDLDVFHDTEEAMDDICRKDMQALEAAGLDVIVVIDVWGCIEARVRDEARRETVVQWMPESRMRFFPLVADPLWGVRLHRSDLAVNKAIAASSRRRTRDAADLVLISRHYCPLGPLFLAASLKLDLSPIVLVDMARQRMAGASNEELGELRTVIGGQNAGEIKSAGFAALDSAETFLRGLPDRMVGGLPVKADGAPTDRVEDMAFLRPVTDGGGRFPDFPETPPEFSDAGGMGGGP